MKTLFETMNEGKTIDITPEIIAAKVEQYKSAERLRNSLPTDKHGAILDAFDADNRRYWNMATQALACIIAAAVNSRRVYGSPIGNVKVYKRGKKSEVMDSVYCALDSAGINAMMDDAGSVYTTGSMFRQMYFSADGRKSCVVIA